MATELDREGIKQAYEDVRSDETDTNWAFLAYNGTQIVLESTGTDYEEFLSKIQDDERSFGYIRVYTGDEMSRRAKFAMITWIGPEVPPLQRAKVSIDKSLVQTLVQNFAKEFQTSEREELQLDVVREELAKAGGANYGTGE